MIQLRFARVQFTPEGAFSYFPDGSCYGAMPHDEPHYHAIAHRLGYEGDILRYCQEHELAHHLIAEEFGSHSLVLWALAHGENVSAPFAAAEEALAMALQRYVRTSEHPFVDRVDWHRLRDRMLGMLSDVPLMRRAA